MSMSSLATDLATELLAEISLLCLPINTPQPRTSLPRPHFAIPSSANAPLLLCAVCRRWRVIAVSVSRLWTSLNSQDIHSPELVELWLARAAKSGLSLRIARPVAPQAASWIKLPVHPPKLLLEHYYRVPFHRHLPVLLPNIFQCRHLEIIDWPLPSIFTCQIPTAPHLETLSVAVRRTDTHAAHWVSLLIAQAPNLTQLHWEGPAISASWSHLTHLSWEIVTDCQDIERKLALLGTGHLQYLRISFRDTWGLRIGPPTVAHSLPTVTTFAFHGEQAIAKFLTLPNLTHLIVEKIHIYTLSADPELDLSILLSRSACSITDLELWEPRRIAHFPDILQHGAIAVSLRRLMISSYHLNKFFLCREREIPGTLHPRHLLLRDVDRCFRIEELPGIDVDESSGALAAVIRMYFPVLESLCLIDNRPMDPDLESRAVLAGSTQLIVSRSRLLLREYLAWWRSPEGDAFRDALATPDTRSFKDVPWEHILQQRYQPHISRGSGNIFSPSTWYK
ncbi:hypothetical protein C8F04DRAFT_1124726 [Mycena alexandri]|uniref:F-box domain-containing protein n=1 Tax=Mycena alexandri TaxID=1745969 RepID=A0AAD6SET3_9AGAR|nr:hypothetical protein C8F04DRAFT_1124726 [Mycena alexandri]